jgi:hypothetical protein
MAEQNGSTFAEQVQSIQVPDVMVKGGTRSGKHDRYIAQQKAEAEARRADADAERKAARTGAEDGQASLYTCQLTDHPDVKQAYVHLTYPGRGAREVLFEGIGDIIMPADPAFPNELALIIFCPQCLKNGPADHAMCTIRQSNRKWELDTRKAGELFMFEGQPYRSAGIVRDGEPFTCGGCSWRARIDDNKVLSL